MHWMLKLQHQPRCVEVEGTGARGRESGKLGKGREGGREERMETGDKSTSHKHGEGS